MEDLSVGSVLGAGRIPGRRKRLLEGILYPWIETLQPLLQRGKCTLEIPRYPSGFLEDFTNGGNLGWYRCCAAWLRLSSRVKEDPPMETA
jgi:hypothetical protein